MIKFLLIFALCLPIAFKGQSQITTSDTTKVKLSLPVAQSLFIDAKQKKVLESEVNLLHADIDILNQRIQEKDQRIAEKQIQINEYKQKDSLNSEVAKTYIAELAVLRSEKQLYVDNKAQLEKQLKVEKRKTKFVAATGTLVAGALLYLYFTK